MRCLAAAGRGRAQTNAARQAYRTAFARGGAYAGDHRLLGAAALRLFAEKEDRRSVCSSAGGETVRKRRFARTADRKGIHATAGPAVGDEMKRRSALLYLLTYLLTLIT